VAAAGGTISGQLTVANGCSGTIASNVSWARPVTGSFTGSGSVEIVVDANVSTSATRTATITARLVDGATDRLTITQARAPVPCTFTTNPASVSLAAGGGSTTSRVSRASTCPTPSISVSANWLTASLASSTSLRITASANTVPLPRSGTVRLVDPVTGAVHAEVAVQQAPAPVAPATCSFSATPALFSLTSAFNPFAVTITPSAASCSPWSAVVDAPWVSLTAQQYSGTAVVRGQALANASPNPRAATITVRGAGGQIQVVTIRQEGTVVSGPMPQVSPAALALDNSFQQVTLQVTTSQCYQVIESASWIAVRGGTQLCGSRSIPLDISFNGGAARSAAILVGGTTVTVSQAGTR
jgi:hypothetical protein